MVAFETLFRRVGSVGPEFGLRRRTPRCRSSHARILTRIHSRSEVPRRMSLQECRVMWKRVTRKGVCDSLLSLLTRPNPSSRYITHEACIITPQPFDWCYIHRHSSMSTFLYISWSSFDIAPLAPQSHRIHEIILNIPLFRNLSIFLSSYR
jgi:hypothetical protein